jgi:hypothetical protein
MDTVLLTARWGSTRHLVRLDRAKLADWAAFSQAVVAAFPTLSPGPAQEVVFSLLVPGGSNPTALTEAELCDVTDLSALR